MGADSTREEQAREFADRPEQWGLAGLRDLVLLLSDSLTPRGVGQWLHARNRLLDGDRPIEALADGRVPDVRRAGLHRRRVRLIADVARALRAVAPRTINGRFWHQGAAGRALTSSPTPP